jgi:hypothetical protein
MCLSKKLDNLSQAPVVHAYNPSYSGGIDQEDHVSKPVWANSSQDTTSKLPKTQKKDWGWWSCLSGRAPA